MIVIKFGGSSISSSKNIEKSLRIINSYKGNVIVFFSAFGGITNLLLECGKLASFIFLINLFDLNGSDNLIKKGYKVENLIEFPGH